MEPLTPTSASTNGHPAADDCYLERASREFEITGNELQSDTKAEALMVTQLLL